MHAFSVVVFSSHYKEMGSYIRTFLIRETLLNCYFSLVCLNSVVGIRSLLMMDCA